VPARPGSRGLPRAPWRSAPPARHKRRRPRCPRRLSVSGSTWGAGASFLNPRARGRDRRPRLLPPGRRAGDAQLTHQPLDRTPCDLGTLPPQLPPYFPRPVHPASYFLIRPYAHDLLLQPLIPHAARRSLALAFSAA
jgi:hypothetical protein